MDRPTSDLQAEGTGREDGQDRVGLEKRYEIFGEYVRTVLSLSTGSLVLSITFLHDVAGIGGEHASPHPLRHPYFLGVSWIGFLVSTAGCLFYLYFLALSSNEEKDCGWQMALGNLAGLSGFAVGLIFLGLFGWLNIPQG